MRPFVPVFVTAALTFASPTARAKEVPQFLSEPLIPAKRETYYKILDRKLLTTPGDFGRMIFRPAFEPEFAVSVYAPKAHATDVFRVTLTEATKSVWSSLTPKQQGYIPAPGTKHNEHDTSSEIRVKRIDVDIDRELALAIQKTWQAMLARDPLPDSASERFIGVDSSSAEFAVRMPNHKLIVRETSTAHGPPAADFVQIGLLLADYCRAPEKERSYRRKELLKGLHYVLREAQKV
jgi:hypothetical protein